MKGTTAMGMTGENDAKGSSQEAWDLLYGMQLDFQRKVLASRGEAVEAPCDSPEWYAYHMLAMVEELGEVLKADKRWKTHRNSRYVQEEKRDEVADVLITALNIAIYSGMSADDLFCAVAAKINENTEKLEKEL